jgi:hypothetical protein
MLRFRTDRTRSNKWITTIRTLQQRILFIGQLWIA